jgi:hypothetical protein
MREDKIIMACRYHAGGAKQNGANRISTVAAQKGQIMPSGKPGFRSNQQHDERDADPQSLAHPPGCQAL